MFKRQKLPLNPVSNQASDLSALRQGTEFLEGKLQGLPEEKRKTFFKLPDTPLVRIPLFSAMAVFFLAAFYLTVQRVVKVPDNAALPLVENGLPQSISPTLAPSPVAPTGGVAASPSPEKSNFRLENENEITRIIFTDESGATQTLREYSSPGESPVREISLSPESGYLAVSRGTSISGSLEIIDLSSLKTIALLDQYGRYFWVNEGKIVFNTAQAVPIPRPYEGGLGFSLATYNAFTGETKIIKEADNKTDFVLTRVVNGEIYFNKIIGSDPETWLKLTESKWRINFEGNIEEEIG